MSIAESRKNEQGFSLFELLMVVAISVVLATTTVQTFDYFTKREVNVLASQQILQVQNAGEEYVSANFTDILNTDIPAVGDVARINTNVLAAAGFLPANFNNVNTFKQATALFVRNAGNNFTGGDTIEVIAISENQGGQDSAFPAQRIIDAAVSAGSKAGVVINLDTGPNCCEGAIQSYNGAWSLPLNTLTAGVTGGNANWTAVAARPDRGYLAAYGRVSFSNTFNGDYLYRVAIDGQPELNRMETNIDMANNDINGVGVVAADNVTVGYAYDPATGLYSDRVVGGAGTGNFLIQGRRTGTGNFTPFALSVDDALQADNGTSTFGFRNVPGACEVDAAGNVTVGNSTACAGGDLVMNNGTLTLNRLTLGSGIADGTTPSFFGARNMTVQNINGANRNFTANFDDGDDGTFDDVRVTTTTTTTDLTAFTLDASVAGNFNTPTLQASGARFQSNVTAEKVVIGEATNIGELQTTGNAQVEGDLQSSGNLDARNLIASETMLIQNMNSCHWDQRNSGNVWYCPNTGCYRENSASPWVCP